MLAATSSWSSGWLIYRGAKSRKAKEQAKAADERQAAANQLTAVNVRQRVTDLGVLMQTVPDGPYRDPLENDLSDVDTTLRRREGKGGLSDLPLDVSPEQDRQHLATLQAVLERPGTLWP